MHATTIRSSESCSWTCGGARSFDSSINWSTSLKAARHVPAFCCSCEFQAHPHLSSYCKLGDSFNRSWYLLLVQLGRWRARRSDHHGAIRKRSSEACGSQHHQGRVISPLIISLSTLQTKLLTNSSRRGRWSRPVPQVRHKMNTLSLKAHVAHDTPPVAPLEEGHFLLSPCGRRSTRSLTRKLGSLLLVALMAYR